MPIITKVKTTTYSINNIVMDVFTFTDQFQQIRKKHRYKANNCFSCQKRFQPDEKLSLAFTDKGNKVLCRECADKYLAQLEKDPAHE